MSTAVMRQLIAAVDANYTDRVTKELLRCGVLHFIRMRELKTGVSGQIHEVAPHFHKDEIIRLRKRVETFLAFIDYNPSEEASLSVDDDAEVKLTESEEKINRLGSEIEGMRERQRQIQQEILRLQDLQRRIGRQETLSPDFFEHSSRLLDFRTGQIPEENRKQFNDAFQQIPSVCVPVGAGGQDGYVLITLKRSADEVEKILETAGWRRVDFSGKQADLLKETGGNFEAHIYKLKDEQLQLRNAVETRIYEEKNTLVSLWKSLQLTELYTTIEQYYGKTASTMLFTGWVPKGKQKILEQAVRKASEGNCYIEWHTPKTAYGIEGTKVPVKFTNPKILSPFQMLVENYSVPEYGTFDPTPVVAVAYLIMFGMMFGDAGHGLILLVAGIAGNFLMKGKPIRRLFQLIIWCGTASIIAGVLFGSYFGIELIRPLWFNFHGAVSGHIEGGMIHDIYGILQLTIYFGIVVIAAGLLINWYNLIRKGRWFRLLLDKTGIIGGWMYGAGAYTAFYFGNHEFKQLPDGVFLFWALGIPSIILLAKPVIEFFLERRHGKQRNFGALTVVDFFMEWIVELLEIFSGYLANTLSFMRVAGLGIAHVSLLGAFFQIAHMVSGPVFNIWAYVILVFGNVLVIVLEGLSAGIQSLRLNYYEFFSKYFSGSGTAYMPVSLKQSEYGG